MKEFKKILFPVDLSEVSAKIAPYVSHVVEKFEAEIYLLFVVRQFRYYADAYIDAETVQDFESKAVAGAEDKIDAFAETHFKGNSACMTKIVLGDAAEEILKYVKDEKIDLVIMGTHGRKGLDRILFGSVAERVIKTATVPVMSINPYRISES